MRCVLEHARSLSLALALACDCYVFIALRRRLTETNLYGRIFVSAGWAHPWRRSFARSRSQTARSRSTQTLACLRMLLALATILAALLFSPNHIALTIFDDRRTVGWPAGPEAGAAAAAAADDD